MIEQFESPPSEVNAMTTRLARPILDLRNRASARDAAFRPGASVWYREDVRLADGASRVVPAIFVLAARRDRCAVVLSHADLGSGRRLYVQVDDVFARFWADGVEDDRPRLAWATPPAPPVDAGPLGPALAAALLGGLLLVGSVAIWFW
jgi:hypothetical protein